MAKKDEQETAVATTRKPTAEQLRSLTTFEDAMNLARELGGEVVKSDVLGDGFTLTEEKDGLVGKPCFFISWTFSSGEFGDFVSARVMVQEPNGSTSKWIINDGSSGLMVQLGELTDQDITNVFAPRGLRRSDYKKAVWDEKLGAEVEKPATTFYLDTSSTAK